jgi:hypothetical protein
MRNPRENNELGKDEGKTEGKRRNPRVSYGQTQRLEVPSHLLEKGYRYYWAIDDAGELDKMEASWYEAVVDAEGRKVIKAAGGGRNHVLMRIEEKYYKEDFEAQQRQIDETMNQVNQPKSDEYGLGSRGLSGEGSAIRATKGDLS